MDEKMLTRTRSRPPSDLQAPGRRFWRDVLAAYELNEAELRLLAEASRTVDELERLRAALAGASPVVPGSTGQDRPHPLYDEVRRHREILMRLVAGLAIPSAGDDVGVPQASVNARRAAQVRWLGEARRGAS